MPTTRPMRRLALLLPLLLAACRAETTFEVKGRVAGFSDDRRTIFVEHEAIPGFMAAMTMPFRVAAGDSLPGTLQSGDAVGFTLVVAESTTVRAVRRLPDAAVARHPAGAINAGPVPEGAPLAVGDAVPPVRLTDHTGRPLTLADYRGRAVVVDFIYTRCPLPDFCPLLSSKMQALQAPLRERFGARAALLSVSFDPAHDTPAVLAAYRARYAAPGGAGDAAWRFAVPDSAGLAAVTGPFGLYRREEGATIEHNLVTAIVGPDGVLRRIWRDADYRTEDVVEEVALVLGPAAPSGG